MRFSNGNVGTRYILTIVPKVKVKFTQSYPILCNPMDIQSMEFSRSEHWSGVAFPFSRGSSQSRSSTWQEGSLPAEPQGKPKNTGVGRLSLLQWICLTQEWNRGLLHCRWTVYQLSHQRIPTTVPCSLLPCVRDMLLTLLHSLSFPETLLTYPDYYTCLIFPRKHTP